MWIEISVVKPVVIFNPGSLPKGLPPPPQKKTFPQFAKMMRINFSVQIPTRTPRPNNPSRPTHFNIFLQWASFNRLAPLTFTPPYT